MKISERVIKKLYKAWVKLSNERKLRKDCYFMVDYEISHVILEAIKNFNLNLKDQGHETFFQDANRQLRDYLFKMESKKRLSF